MMSTGLLMDQLGAVSTSGRGRIYQFNLTIVSANAVRSLTFSAESISKSQTGETRTVLACCMMAMRAAIHRRPSWFLSWSSMAGAAAQRTRGVWIKCLFVQPRAFPPLHGLSQGCRVFRLIARTPSWIAAASIRRRLGRKHRIISSTSSTSSAYTTTGELRIRARKWVHGLC